MFYHNNNDRIMIKQRTYVVLCFLFCFFIGTAVAQAKTSHEILNNAKKAWDNNQLLQFNLSVELDKKILNQHTLNKTTQIEREWIAFLKERLAQPVSRKTIVKNRPNSTPAINSAWKQTQTAKPCIKSGSNLPKDRRKNSQSKKRFTKIND